MAGGAALASEYEKIREVKGMRMFATE